MKIGGEERGRARMCKYFHLRAEYTTVCLLVCASVCVCTVRTYSLSLFQSFCTQWWSEMCGGWWDTKISSDDHPSDRTTIEPMRKKNEKTTRSEWSRLCRKKATSTTMMMTQLHKQHSQGFKKMHFTFQPGCVRACESLQYYLLIFIYFISFHFMCVCECASVCFALNAFEWKIRFFFRVIMFFFGPLAPSSS